MYICICKGVSAQEVDEAVKLCGPSVEKVSRSCGAATDCGSCLVRLENYLAQNSSSLSGDREGMGN